MLSVGVLGLADESEELMASTSFRDWLTEQSKKGISEVEREDRKKEWLNALESLFGQLSAWLREDDVGEVVKIKTGYETIKEEEFGPYQAPLLQFELSQRVVTVRPVARNVIGPARGAKMSTMRGEGRVDLTNGVMTLHLYRVSDGDSKLRWVIVDPFADPFYAKSGTMLRAPTFKELDKEAFEDALRRLFS